MKDWTVVVIPGERVQPNSIWNKKIIMIADVFVALTEDRPYRKGMSIGASLDVIVRQVQSGLLDEYVFTKLRDLVAEGLDFTRIEHTKNPFLL
jgi:HD-GYP domain-containing protein (c-di-GMP phosphodiesterase class II)